LSFAAILRHPYGEPFVGLARLALEARGADVDPAVATAAVEERLAAERWRWRV
jgi:hypothetical protein